MGIFPATHTLKDLYLLWKTSINLHMNSYTTVIVIAVSSLIERGGENNEPNNRALSE